MDKEKVNKEITKLQMKLSMQELMYLADILNDWIPFTQLEQSYKERRKKKYGDSLYLAKYDRNEDLLKEREEEMSRTFKDLSKEEQKELINDLRKDVERYYKENKDTTLTLQEIFQFLGIEKEREEEMSLFTKETIKRLRKDLREKYPEMEEKEFKARFQEALKQYKFEIEKRVEKEFNNHTFKSEGGDE